MADLSLVPPDILESLAATFAQQKQKVDADAALDATKTTQAAVIAQAEAEVAAAQKKLADAQVPIQAAQQVADAHTQELANRRQASAQLLAQRLQIPTVGEPVAAVAPPAPAAPDAPPATPEPAPAPAADPAPPATEAPAAAAPPAVPAG